MVKKEVGSMVKPKDLQVGDYYAYKIGNEVYRVVCIDGDNVVYQSSYSVSSGNKSSDDRYYHLGVYADRNLVIMEDWLTRQVKNEEIRRANLPNEVKEYFANKANSNRVGSRVKVRDIRVGEYIKFDNIERAYYEVLSEVQHNSTGCVKGIDYSTGNTFPARLGLYYSGDTIVTIVNEKGKVN